MIIGNLVLAFFAAIVAFLFNLYITPYLIHLSKKKSWYDDAEDERKIHTGQISRLGGIGIVISFVISVLISVFGISRLISSDISFSLPEEFRPLLIMTAVVLIFIIGVLDDFANLRARVKLIGQIAAALLLMAAGANIPSLTIPFTAITLNLGFFGYILTLFWIIGVTNAINLIDGLDGLSASLSSVACFFYGLIFLITGQFLLSFISFTLLGAVMGYLFYNFPPAKIFMGDSGSLTLGFILALLPLLNSTANGDILIMPIVLLSIPIADVLSAMLRRTRKGLHFFNPDKEHMHHKLLDLDLDARQILSVVMSLQIIGGLSTLLFHRIPSVVRYLPVGIALLLVFILFLYLHWDRHYRKK
ncbi:MAG: MraY family glycosyltransferase [Spirochaetales bacterium]|nr:MraY family glycosyltransferase [Spirochaetales bacterium]